MNDLGVTQMFHTHTSGNKNINLFNLLNSFQGSNEKGDADSVQRCVTNFVTSSYHHLLQFVANTSLDS